MKKIVAILPLALIITACASGPVDDTNVAECSRMSGKIVQAPGVERMGGDNFLSRYQRDREADNERARAAKLGCQ